MANWKKISLREAVGKVVFDDELGFFRFNGDISYTVNGNGLTRYLVDEGGEKKGISTNIYENVNELEALFSKPLYEQVYRGYSSYGRRSYERSYEYKKVDFNELTVTVNANNRYSSNRLDAVRSFTIGKTDAKRLEYLKHVWVCKEIQDGNFNPDGYLKQPLFDDLKADGEILLNGYKHKILAVYEQPDENGYMFSAVPSYEGAKGEKVNVSFKDSIRVLPYEKQTVSEFMQFNKCKNEFALSPYAVKSGLCLNVYWNKYEPAAGYTVSLYKVYDRPYMRTIYHLKDYAADRNDGFISIDGLADDGYIVTVKAENRGGEEIALSRGISIKEKDRCVPQYFKED